jgi:hypothetical protein
MEAILGMAGLVVGFMIFMTLLESREGPLYLRRPRRNWRGLPILSRAGELRDHWRRWRRRCVLCWLASAAHMGVAGHRHRRAAGTCQHIVPKQSGQVIAEVSHRKWRAPPQDAFTQLTGANAA